MAARSQHTPEYRELCRILRSLREAAGLTQRELAPKVGLHNSMVHRSEIGDRRIDPVEFARWCRACGADPSEVIRELEGHLA